MYNFLYRRYFKEDTFRNFPKKNVISRWPAARDMQIARLLGASFPNFLADVQNTVVS